LTDSPDFKYFIDEPIKTQKQDKFNFNIYVDAIEEILNKSNGIINIGIKEFVLFCNLCFKHTNYYLFAQNKVYVFTLLDAV